MKKFYLLLISYLMTIPVSAQSASTLSENSVWTYLREIRQGTKAGGAFLYHLGEEYELQGKTYRRLVLYDNVYELPTSSAKLQPRKMPEPEEIQLPGIREEEGRILVNRDEYLATLDDGKRQCLPYRETAGGEIIIYDYNMPVNDKFLSVEGREDIIVEKIETVRAEDDVTERKLFVLSNGLVILEGVGCMNSIGGLLDYLFYDANDLAEDEDSKYAAWLFSYEFMSSEMHRLLFGDEYKAYMPSGLTLIDADRKKISSTNDYGLNGIRMKKKPQQGIYIHDGRKYIVE